MSRKEEIVDKAIEIAVKGGFQCVTIKSLAEACGITEPAIYRHFKSKDDIIVAVIDRLQDSVIQIVKKGTEKASISALRRTIKDILKLLAEMKGIGVLLLSESSYTNNATIKERLFDFYNAFVGSFEDFYRKLKSSHTLSAKADCKAIAILTVAIFQSTSVRFILSGGKIPIDQKASAMVSILLKGASCE